LNAFLEHVHWEGTATQDFIVEGANIEFVAELILGVLAQLENFELTNRVA
jgi:hypothetical protein